MSRLADHYQKVVLPKLKAEFADMNVHELPYLEKIVVSTGVGRASQDSRLIEVATNTLRKVTGQSPVTTKAKHSIAGFKLREGQKVGLKVTLRRHMMYDFLDRLISVVVPRFRDFHGLARSGFDASGNYNIGINDQAVFPELSFEETSLTHGLQITIVTRAQNRDQAARLLELLGLPLERSEVNG